MVFVRLVVKSTTPNEFGDLECEPTDMSGNPTTQGRYLYINKREIITKGEAKAL